MLPEGTIRNWDGVNIPIAPPLEGLDLNRNWPADWAPESEQLGAGPFPTSEPEVRALVEAIIARNEHHVVRRLPHVLRRAPAPVVGHSDDDFPVPDLRAFKLMGEEATRLTGYPSISIFHDFKYHPKQVIKGGDVDWIYDHLGRISRGSTEFWSPQRRAGITDYHFIEWMREHSARGRPRDPEGGRRARREGTSTGTRSTIRSSARSSSAAGTASTSGSTRRSPSSRPRCSRTPTSSSTSRSSRRCIEIRSFEAEPVGDGAHRLRLVGRERRLAAHERHARRRSSASAVRPIEVELELPEGARVATGKEREEAGQLGGRVERRDIMWWGTDHSTAERTKVEWVVEAPAGTKVAVVARHERAGTVRAELVL